MQKEIQLSCYIVISYLVRQMGILNLLGTQRTLRRSDWGTLLEERNH